VHAQIVLFDGFDPLDVIAPYEVLHAGGTASGGAVKGRVGEPGEAPGVEEPGEVPRSGEPGEVPDHRAGAGDRRQDEFVPVLLGRALTTELPALLKEAMDNPEVTTSSVCGGSLILAMAGLLEGRYATTHHLGLDMLDATGVHAVNARVVGRLPASKVTGRRRAQPATEGR
jgi:putative intracellular protease/amidase